ncbi:type I-E CRISPR-associated protein Cas6/Cse3/CasE [Phytomonospora endophytica]|uniref:CRISPR system Cascade subunit CasE n=1 Tax=Phytomonospora endophytica TaxID=714109 RepID=A0A841G690_9ACTN|nr:type I-E CRISPR-associated protein Cas6/Cse3/CasE [Phytomonospora endophytica]MBB6039590.1 CRISPR system Cascade subunit CasE [Phytomonospora endophytica]GIG70555.1 type I-E CRISPR-associated protein Cas6/Cse3/CasE [Phytomonospora endophytica]
MMTTWLTKITLVAGDRAVQRLLDDAGALHNALMRLVPDGLGDHPRAQTGLLYRVEQHTRTPQILAQTTVEPDISRLDKRLADQVAVRDLTGFLTGLRNGNRVRYRITANPTKRHGRSANDGKAGKLYVVSGALAERWWTDRAAEGGLDVRSVEYRKLPEIRVRAKGSHAAAQFDGGAVITDADHVRAMITDGLGRAKSYGCGLLSLGPA